MDRRRHRRRLRLILPWLASSSIRLMCRGESQIGQGSTALLANMALTSLQIVDLLTPSISANCDWLPQAVMHQPPGDCASQILMILPRRIVALTCRRALYRLRPEARLAA
jgi:hypothetical protein